MKRLSLLGFGLLASVLAGCPIWSDGNNGSQGQGCEDTNCSSGNPGGCVSSAECPANYTCGSNNQCDPGDCVDSGCSTGFVCVVDPSTDTASCQPTGAGGSGGTGPGSTTGSGAGSTTGSGAGSTTGTGTGGTGTASTTGTGTTTGTGATTGTGGAPPVVYCGHPADCSSGDYCAADGTCHTGSCSATAACIYGYDCQSGTCVSPNPNACDKNADCAPGSLCISGTNGKGGTCTTAANQCFDQSQCDPGDNCVAGTCTIACSATNADCRDGYTCNTSLGVCTSGAMSCTVTKDCGGAFSVCVGGVCVPRSGPSGTCPAGDVWDENGCIPNQSATFTCQMDGVQDACTSGSICLHHDCWISCDSPNQSACMNQISELGTCEPVVDGTKTYNVCGSATNLGQQCGPGAPTQSCTAAQVCIDGFCR